MSYKAYNMMTTQPIRIEKQTAHLQHHEAGAWNIFAGTVRHTNYQRQVSYLEYEAFESLAEKMIIEIADEAKRKFPLLHAFCVHRIGRVAIGEIAVLIIYCFQTPGCGLSGKRPHH